MVNFKCGAAALAILMAMPHMAAAQDDFTIKLGGRYAGRGLRGPVNLGKI